jgi:hypothetical protein
MNFANRTDFTVALDPLVTVFLAFFALVVAVFVFFEGLTCEMSKKRCQQEVKMHTCSGSWTEDVFLVDDQQNDVRIDASNGT